MTDLFEDIVDSESLRELVDQVSYRERWKAADILAGQINGNLEERGIGRYADNFPNDDPPETAAKMIENGCVGLGQLLSPAEVSEVVSYFEKCCCYNAHVYRYSDRQCYNLAQASQYPFVSYQIEDVLRAPYLLELANHPQIIATAAAYLGATPSFYSLNAWWSFGAKADAENVTQGYHRDTDDFRFCSLFVYLTDVEEDGGDHQYFRQTHRPELVEKFLEGTGFTEIEIATGEGSKTVYVDLDHLFNSYGYGGDAVYEKLFEDRKTSFVGPAGSAFMTDPFGLHRGSPSLQGRRLAFWARYGLFDNNAYHGDVAKPLEIEIDQAEFMATPRQKYINRLIIRQD